MIRIGARAPAISIALAVATVLAPGAAGSPLSATPAERSTFSRQAVLMGTRVTLTTVAPDRDAGLRELDRLLRTLEGVEAELSTWKKESDLSAINAQPVGAPRPAPERVCSLLSELGRWHRRTGAAFDPAVGALIDAWGLRRDGRIPGTTELSRARMRSGLAHLRIDASPCTVTRTRDIRLDAGAFGKGAALDRVAAENATLPDGSPGPGWMIDLGGQVGVGGSADRAWPVALAHPERRGEIALELSLRSGSVATSGGSERDLHIGGERIGHVLDPRTGEPVSRSGSVTAWHRRALVADVLSTALYVMGPEEGLAWARRHDYAVCYLVPEDDGSRLEIRATDAFLRLLRGRD